MKNLNVRMLELTLYPLIINGGAAVALLGFLSTIWGRDSIEPLISSILDGLIYLSFGVFFAASNFFFRYWTSRGHQHNWYWRFRVFWFLEWASVTASLLVFPWAIILLTRGVNQSIGAG